MSNILFCISGPSGSGKTTIMRNVMRNELLSFTTRPMRKGEIDGKDYSFITQDKFNDMFFKNELIEFTEYDGFFYGLSSEEMNMVLNEHNAFFICDNNGFNQVKDKYDNIVSIFLYADKEDCMYNMVNRGDKLEKAYSRLSTYEEEVGNKGQYDYVVKNVRGKQFHTSSILFEIIASEIERNKEVNE